VAFAHTQAPAARYVAIGDSYASGESDTPFDADSDRPGADECHRSGAAYPFRVTIARPADVHALACSGASTVDLTQASVLPDNVDNTPWRTVDDYRYGEVNQVDESGWLDQDTTLVTVTVGADDVGWRDVLAACRTAACTSGGYRLTRASGTDPQPLVSYEPYLIGQLRWHLAAVYRAVHANAPHARVLVVGYPHLFDVSPVCEGFAPDVQSWLNGLSDQLAQAATGAVADVRQAD